MFLFKFSNGQTILHTGKIIMNGLMLFQFWLYFFWQWFREQFKQTVETITPSLTTMHLLNMRGKKLEAYKLIISV